MMRRNSAEFSSVAVQNDTELWQAMKNGSRAAFQTIYEEHIDAILQYGRRFSSDQQLVEDCVHDLFVNIWRTREGASQTDAIRQYLLVAVRRILIKRLKKAQAFQDLPEENIHFEQEDNVETELIEAEQASADQYRLTEAMQQLSARQREAIFLKYHQGVAYEEIAKIMGINYQSVRNLVFNGITKLRKLLQLILWCLWPIFF